MRARLLAFAIFMLLGPGLTACATPDLKAEGEPCFASSECDVGLTCDFGSDPAVCRTQQTGGGPSPDGGITPDARPGVTPDAGDVVPPPDAGNVVPPDAGIVVPPDAAVPPPDAAPVPPDAALPPPDAAV
jgi:hypothetical protein